MSAPSLSDRIHERHRTVQLSEELQKLGVRLGTRGLPLPARKAQDNVHVTGIDSVVPGQVWETPYGPCFVVEKRYPLDHAHGRHLLAELLANGGPSPLLARLAGDERVAQLDFRSAIFFDIETTGLGTGSGICAFLVGVGVFDGQDFCLRQYFMRDYNEEKALLHLLDRQAQEWVWWVSFNGRNFDLPVLQTRFVCMQREMPLLHAPHLDLLYPARRLWRRRLVSCALSSLERGILGVTRGEDVPGWLIPELYFGYLRSGEAQPLRSVFTHNALDVLSLVTLAAQADAMLRGSPGTAVEHAIDLYSLGMVYEACGQPVDAQRAYEQALCQPLPSALEQEVLPRLAALYKRTHQMERAERIWQILWERDHRVAACVELAKDCEHRRRDYLTAARLVCEALTLNNLPGSGECSAGALRTRLARLRKKMGEGGLPMPHIESYAFGTISVDGKSYNKDLIILPGGVRAGWWRKEGHLLESADLQDVIKARPSVLVIGTGNPGLMKVPQKTLDYLAAQGIRVEVLPTAAACQRYNELAKREQAAAALHLTC